MVNLLVEARAFFARNLYQEVELSSIVQVRVVCFPAALLINVAVQLDVGASKRNRKKESLTYKDLYWWNIF